MHTAMLKLVTCYTHIPMTDQSMWQLSVLQAEQVTPDVPLPGLKQKGKEAEAIGKAPAQSGPGASDQVTFQPCPLLALLRQCLSADTQEGQVKHGALLSCSSLAYIMMHSMAEVVSVWSLLIVRSTLFWHSTVGHDTICRGSCQTCNS